MIGNALAVGLRTLAANPLRTFLSTLGVIIGTAALVAVLAVGDGVEAYARRQIASQTDLQQFSVTPTTGRRLDGVWLPRPDTVELGVAELESLRTALGEGVALTLVRAGGTLVELPGEAEPRGATVRAMLGDRAGTPDSLVRAGRGFRAGDAAGSALIALITPDLADAIDPGGSVVGTTLHLNGTAFTVVGVAGHPGVEDKRLGVQVPFGSYPRAVPRQLLGTTGIMGSAVAVEAMPEIVARAEAWATARGGDGLSVGSRGDMLVEMRKGMLVARLFMGAITGISLLVGGIGIMNVLLAGVVERTREIGIRRAAGAQRRDIVGQFLAESVVITGAGSLLGLALGIAAAFGVAALMRARVDAPVHAALTAVPILVAAISAIVIGLTFGIYPALKASRLSPIDAIRTE